MNPLDFPGKQFRMELMNPNPSSRMSKDGPIYKCSFEITKEAHEQFMTANTSGMVIAAVCQVVDENAKEPPKRTWNDLGPLCKSAIDLCKEKKFWEFMNHRWGGESIEKEADAEKVFKYRFGVKSRTELDTDIEAGYGFKSVLRDYRKWLEANA